MTPGQETLLQRFESTEIVPGVFGHKEHLEVAYAMLRKYSFIDATAKYTNGIRKLAAAAGAPRKFSATITFAFMSLLAERMANAPSADFPTFISNNRDLQSSDILARWYSPERLSSNLSRSVFLLPDRLGAESKVF